MSNSGSVDGSRFVTEKVTEGGGGGGSPASKHSDHGAAAKGGVTDGKCAGDAGKGTTTLPLDSCYC